VRATKRSQNVEDMIVCLVGKLVKRFPMNKTFLKHFETSGVCMHEIYLERCVYA
jgi:hypothetical protein